MYFQLTQTYRCVDECDSHFEFNNKCEAYTVGKCASLGQYIGLSFVVNKEQTRTCVQECPVDVHYYISSTDVCTPGCDQATLTTFLSDDRMSCI